MSACKITAYNLLQRRQYQRYVGQLTTAVGAYPYVVSPVVPITQYWIVWWLSLISGKGTVTCSNPFVLYLLQNGATQPRTPAGNNPDDPFFLNYNNFVHLGGNPGAYGLRVDRFNLGSVGAFDLPARLGDEVQMLDKPLLVAPGESLMGWSQQYAAGPAVGSLMEMRLAVSIMNQTDDVPVRF
jgi:hypothetical protein